ncbi:MAG: hypothetical protein R6W69_12820 [Anaerolineales bacterium]
MLASSLWQPLNGDAVQLEKGSGVEKCLGLPHAVLSSSSPGSLF